jgi:hypothetical protein
VQQHIASKISDLIYTAHVLDNGVVAFYESHASCHKRRKKKAWRRMLACAHFGLMISLSNSEQEPYHVEVAEPDPTREIRPTRPDSNPTRLEFFKKVKLIRSDPNSTRPDPTRDQMTFNPIEIYQRYEKTQHIN